MTSVADSPYYSYLGTTVNFCGNQWDVIGLNDNGKVAGSSAAVGTDEDGIREPHSAMLLLHNTPDLAKTTIQLPTKTSRFSVGGASTAFGGNNTYEGSNLQSVMIAEATICAANFPSAGTTAQTLEAAGVKNTSLTTSDNNASMGGPAYSITAPATIDNQYLFPLSYQEAVKAGNDASRAFTYSWWLRSPGDQAVSEIYVSGGGGINRNGELGAVYDDVLARPALQISLDSFAVPQGTKITLANRIWDVIGAGTQPFVTPVSDYTPLPTMGDPDTLTLLYDKDNVNGTFDGRGVPAQIQDKDWIGYLSTSFNPSSGNSCQSELTNNGVYAGTDNGLFSTAIEDTNAYDGSCLQAKLNDMYSKFGINAGAMVLPRAIPTQESPTTQGAEAFGNGSPIANQYLWALSNAEASNIPDDCMGHADWYAGSGGHTCYLRTFPNHWRLRSPGNATSLASIVDGNGTVYGGSGFSVAYANNPARPALQIASDSGLLSSVVTGLTLAGDSTVSTGGTVTISPSVQGGTSPLTWTYSGNGITSLTNGVVVASSVSSVRTAEICAETALGEFKRCKTLKVLPKGDTPDLDIDYTNETITGFEASTSYKYCVDTANTCTPSTAYTPGAVAKPITDFGAISNSDTKYLRIVKSQIEDVSVDSDIETVTIPPRPTAPAVSAASGTISGLTTNMEYNTTGVSFAGSWTAIAGATLSGIAEGTYYIRDKAVDGASGHFLSNVATVALTIPVTGVNVAPTSPSITYGETVQLAETVLPSDTPIQTVNWSSSNTNVATVDATGLVTSVSAGDATITAKSTTDQTKYGEAIVSISKKVLAVSLGSIVIPDRPYIAGTITAPVTGVVAITSGIVNSDAITVSSCSGNYADDTVATGKSVALTCTLSGTKASSYTINSYPAPVGTILDYKEVDLGDHDIEVPTDAAVTPESAPGAGDGYVTLPTTDPEYEVIIDDTTVIVPGGSVIHENGTITVPAGNVTINGQTIDAPAGSVVNPATGDITLPNGKVAVTQTKGSERLALSSATITQGKSLTITGSGFTPNELVRLELHAPTQVLSASVTVNASGKFTLTKAVTTATAAGTYQVVAYDKTSNIQLKSANLKVVKPAPTKPGPVSAKAKKAKGSITFIWGASGFLTTVEIYYRVKGTSKWKIVRVSSADHKKIKLKCKKTYQFQLRSYKTVSGKNYYSAWTKKTVKL
jgi:hypothetical protein